MVYLQIRLSIHKLTVDNESENLKKLLLYIIIRYKFYVYKKKKRGAIKLYITHGEASSTYGGRENGINRWIDHKSDSKRRFFFFDVRTKLE